MQKEAVKKVTPPGERDPITNRVITKKLPSFLSDVDYPDEKLEKAITNHMGNWNRLNEFLHRRKFNSTQLKQTILLELDRDNPREMILRRLTAKLNTVEKEVRAKELKATIRANKHIVRTKAKRI